MIVIEDRIRVAGADLGRLQRMLEQDYRPGAEQRGLTFLESMVSPPVKMHTAPCALVARWQVPDVAAWWAQRAQSADPAVKSFWAAVDEFCLSRERVYMTAENEADLPEPVGTSAFEVATRGHRETAQLALRSDLTTDQRDEFVQLLMQADDELPGLEASCLGGNLAPDYAAGDYTWDLLYPDRETAEAARRSDFWRDHIEPALREYCQACHALALETLGAGLRRPGLSDGIKRTGYFRMLPRTRDETAQRFERDLLEMPAQIPEILNWRLSRAHVLPWDRAGVEPWTYVWEQEFEALEGLTGPYMTHPHHWAHIDRWFDPESGAQAVDVNLSHAFSSFTESLMTREAQS